MHQPKAWLFHEFGATDPLSTELHKTTQVQYLRCYLTDLRTRWVIEEPSYFDRDYLSECSAFYSQSARGYSNACRRLLFFDENAEDLSGVLDSALAGDGPSEELLRASFLGFTVLRPIPKAPFGRTVLRWYPERQDKPIRQAQPRRPYIVHLAGMPLCVRGLAWQQQDAGVSACATIAIWSMLHSRAFNERHAVPTTASITLAAHRRAPWGARVFPSDGLNPFQLMDGIKELGFNPVRMDGNVERKDGLVRRFSRARFCALVAAAVRSAYPVLLVGRRDGDDVGHAICVVGFRPGAPESVASGHVALADRDLDALYIHDDNLGPGVRFVVKSIANSAEKIADDSDPFISQTIQLIASPPEPIGKRPVPCPTSQEPPFVPESMIIAALPDVRTTPDDIHRWALTGVASGVANGLEEIEKKAREKGMLPGEYPSGGVELAIRFIEVSRYLRELIPKAVSEKSIASRVRRALCETAPPMSRHLAVVRLEVEHRPFIDVLYDTTDSLRNLSAFAHVAFHSWASALSQNWPEPAALGVRVDAF